MGGGVDTRVYTMGTWESANWSAAAGLGLASPVALRWCDRRSWMSSCASCRSAAAGATLASSAPVNLRRRTMYSYIRSGT